MFERAYKSITILSLVVFLSACSVGHMMIHEQRSPYDFDKTVATIVNNAKENNWLVPKVYDFQASLTQHGQTDPGKIKLIKLCRPEYAAKMLSNEASRYVSVMMPCSVSVYEKSDGVYVSSMNMSLMSTVMGGEIGEILGKVAEDDRVILDFLYRH